MCVHRLEATPRGLLHYRRSMKRARQVQSGEKQPKEVGCKGPPMFVSDDINKGLFYLSADSFFLIPIGHCLLYGVVRSCLHRHPLATGEL